MNINFQAMVDYVPKAMLGWLSVFIVTAVVIASIWVLNKATAKKKG